MKQGNPNTREYWDTRARSGGKEAKTRHYSFYGGIVDYLHDEHHHGEVILDIGCFVGILLRDVQKANPLLRLYGVDISPQAIEFARENVPEGEFTVGEVPPLPYKDNSFDVILCTETLEHLDEPVELVKEARRVLKPGGEFIVSVPEGDMKCEEHMTIYSLQSFMEQMSPYLKLVKFYIKRHKSTKYIIGVWKKPCLKHI